MSIQHENIPEAHLHEPKGVSVAATKTVYHADGVGSGSWRKTLDTDMDYSDKTTNRFGWNDISDSLYTSGSPRAISSGARTQLTNNALKAQTDTSRLGVLWNSSTNLFLINDLNAFYTLRIAYKCTAAAVVGVPYIVLTELESANASTVIAGYTQIIKGGGAVNQVTHTLGFYNGSFINNQSLKIYLTPDTNVNIYDVGLVLQRTYVET